MTLMMANNDDIHAFLDSLFFILSEAENSFGGIQPTAVKPCYSKGLVDLKTTK